MNNRAILKNIVFSIGQVIGISILLFLFYKKATEILGKETFGIWSLVMGISSLANLGNLGLAGGLVKYSAEFYVLKKYQNIRDSLNVSVIFVGLFFALICSLLYFLKSPIINYVINNNEAKVIARDILPYSLMSLLLNGISMLFFSVIDGINKGYIKNIFSFISTLFFVIISLSLLNSFSIFAIVYAQIIQSLFFLFAGMISVIILIPNYSLIQFKWRKKLFKKIFKYSINIQGIGIITLLYEPIIKGILSKYSGLGTVSFYEIGNKIIQQSKAFINLSVVNLIPKISALSVTNQNEEAKNMYYKTAEIDLYVSLIIFLGLIGFSPLISKFSFNNIDLHFIYLFFVLCLANFINALSIPAFHFASAEGQLNTLLNGNFLILTALFVFTTLIYYFHFPNYIWSWGIALSLGSIYFIVMYQKNNSLNYYWLINKKMSIIFFLLLLLTFLIYYLCTMFFNSYLIVFLYLSLVVILNYLVIIKYRQFHVLNNLIDNFKIKE